MRSFFSASILAVAVLSSTVNSASGNPLRSLRAENENNPYEFKVDIRDLQSADVSGTGFDNEDFENDGSDASLLNRLIRLILPVANAAFQAIVPDPLEINQYGDFQLGELNLLICSASVDLSYDFGSVVGLKSMAIDDLRVVLGSERVDFGCFETLWNAAFDMTLASRSNFTVDTMSAGIFARGCGLNFTREFGGGINTYQPMMRGAVNISGSLAGTTATIDFAEVAKSLQVGYESVEVYLDDAPESYNTILKNATRELSVMMKDELVDTVGPTVKPIVEETLRQSRQLSYNEFLSINSGFAYNGAKRQVSSFYNTASTFLGFGTKEEEEEETVSAPEGERQNWSGRRN